jgi:hypothetical protein
MPMAARMLTSILDSSLRDAGTNTSRRMMLKVIIRTSDKRLIVNPAISKCGFEAPGVIE